MTMMSLVSRPCPVLVAEQAAARPDAPAVVAGDAVLGYGELDQRANRLAHHLIVLGVGPETPVAVGLPRSPELVVALLAVLRAGGAYLPLDPEYPARRLDRMLTDARPPVLVTAEPVASALPDCPGATVVDLGRDAPRIASLPATDPGVPLDPDALAYVIYTSGSTGEPKGVQVPHRGLSNLIGWHVSRYRIGPGEHTAHVAAIGFDASVWEIWPTLAAGATLHLPAAEDRLDPARLVSWLASSGITVTFLPTPVAEEVLRVPASSAGPRTVLTGGDALTAVLPPGLPYELVNHYGPTEASVVATAGTVTPGEPGPPPIGHAIDGVTAHLLDEDLRPVPDGEPGELYVGGAGLARGYLGRPDLTADRFVPDPFGTGTRLYRTGDVCRGRDDGAIEFLGRADDQVKIRGVRVELGEIAARLREHPGVLDAVAVRRSGPDGDRYIAGYVTYEGDEPPDPTEVVAGLRQTLPAPVVPAAVLAMRRFPLTPNGKVDRAALPEPARVAAVAPRDDVEELVARTWYEVLERPDREPDVHDNFFVLGGHSLLAARLSARLRELFGVPLPVQVTLRAPTIAELADEIRAGDPDPGQVAEVAALHRKVAELSDEQVAAMLAELGGGEPHP
ncbi:MAG TPA: amino acid adenylation domain-containing protein [Actinophytocola sp.]|nr:amino acid adenylation domain-containing protein [Actinophytocola sp.]